MAFEIVSTPESFNKINSGLCHDTLARIEAKFDEIADDPDGRIRLSKGIPYPIGVRLSQFHFEMAGKMRYFTVFLLRDDIKSRLTVYDVLCYPPLSD